jgi:hypothetical protein
LNLQNIKRERCMLYHVLSFRRSLTLALSGGEGKNSTIEIALTSVSFYIPFLL